MGVWDSYQREETEKASAITGKYRVVIVEAFDDKTGPNSKAPGTPMIVVKVRPSGRHFSVTHRIVKNDWFNRNMTEFFDAFPEIKDGDFNFLSWVGAEGAAIFREGNNGYTEVAKFISPERAASLPPFEGDKPERQTITTLADEDESADDDDLPFM